MHTRPHSLLTPTASWEFPKTWLSSVHSLKVFPELTESCSTHCRGFFFFFTGKGYRLTTDMDDIHGVNFRESTHCGSSSCSVAVESWSVTFRGQYGIILMECCQGGRLTQALVPRVFTISLPLIFWMADLSRHSVPRRADNFCLQFSQKPTL